MAQEAADKPKKPEAEEVVAEQKIPDFIIEIFEKANLASSESPRANVIIAVSYVDELVTKLLKKVLIKPPEVEDKLFDSYGPLYNLGPKIDVAYRLGLISEDLSWVLHRLRKLRDECAHSHEAKDFSTGTLKDLIDVVYSKMHPDGKPDEPINEKFQMIFRGIYIKLWVKINNSKEYRRALSEF